MPIWLTLTPSDLNRAYSIGFEWHSNRRRAGSIHKNNRQTSSSDRLMMQRAVAAEMAAHYALGTTHWSYAGDIIGKPKQADLDDFIDVRLRDDKWDHQLIVQFNDNPSWAYLSAKRIDAQTFFLDRWCWGYEIMHNGFVKSLQRRRPAYCAGTAEPFMKDALELRELVAVKRQRKSDPAEPAPR